MDRRAVLERDILRNRAEQRASQMELEASVDAEVAALHQMDAARANQDRCRRKIDEYAEAISSLQDELRDFMPPQRRAEGR